MVEMQRGALGADRAARFLRGRRDRRLAGLYRLRGGRKSGERQGRGGEEQGRADGSLLQAGITVYLSRVMRKRNGPGNGLIESGAISGA